MEDRQLGKRLIGATSGTREQSLLKNNNISSNYYRSNLSFDYQKVVVDDGHQDSGQTRGQTQFSTNEDSSNDLSNQQRTTEGQTMMHILKANIGTGVLAMPLAFKNVGLWLGLILVPIIGAICIHCMNILIASHNRLCDRFNFESLDYDQVAALGLASGPKWARRFAKKAHIVVTIFLMLTQIGFCCVYTLFTVENLQVAMLNLFSLDYSTTTYLVLVLPVIGLTSCTSNLKYLARISTLANVLQLFGLSLILYDLLQFHTYSDKSLQKGSTSDDLLSKGSLAQSSLSELVSQQALSEQVIVVEPGVSSDLLTGLPLFFATAVYAFEGIGVVLPLIKEMQHPGRISGLNGVLNTSMSMVAVLYMAVGFFGYAKYGQTVAGSITLNLPETTVNELVRLAFALAIGLSYSLQFYVPWTIVWPIIDESLFYSYRPRVPRDKLDILQKLNKDNHWAITGQAIEEHQREQALKRREQQKQQQLMQQRLSVLDDGQQAAENSTTTLAVQTLTSNNNNNTAEQQSAATCLSQQPSQQLHDQNSTASTLATSYSMSTSYRWPAQPIVNSRRAFVTPVAASGSANTISFNQYGAIESTQQQPLVAASHSTSAALKRRKLRNRLEDVMERETSGEFEDDDDIQLPDVQWRPPPRSMRGKRKLVRYTVILLTVSFTFIAAALIPRIDLFISLIGALSSSCLAIIFPAIIQLCTFWNYNQEEDDEQELARAEDQATLELDRQRRKLDDQEDEQRRQEQQRRLSSATNIKDGKNQTSGGDGKRMRRAIWTKTRRFKWYLFVAKNCFLVIFGVLGLITGSWMSLAQLGVQV